MSEESKPIHTCTNTYTTSDGSIPSCKACEEESERKFQEQIKANGGSAVFVLKPRLNNG